MRTSEVIKQFGLDPALEWKRGWKVLRQCGNKYFSCSSPIKAEYKEGIGTTKLFDNGPLTGFQYKKDTLKFLHWNLGVYQAYYVLYPMVYTEFNGKFLPYPALRNETSCQGSVYAVWRCDIGRQGSRGLVISRMPKGTVYAETIVIY